MDKQKQKAVRKAVRQEGAFVDMLNQEMKELQDGMDKLIRDKLLNILKKQNVCCNGNECGRCDYDGDNCVEERLADTLIESGLIIPEGVVVLTREEYKKLESLANDKCHYDCHLIDYPDFEREKMLRDDTRKETAEKFAERVKMAFYYEFDELIPSIMADKIDEICKEITEGKG